MRYPVKIKTDGKGWRVSFPDIPEALTSGGTKEEALAMAKDALETALDFYFDDKREVPSPSTARRGQPVIELSASTSAKVLLLNEMVRQKVRPAELARRLHTTAQEVNRLTNVRHTTRIDGIAAALRALGRHLDMRVV
ncbi:MAG: type II toxin-antitoxin system HicB family antitoxin [Gammaproteobacteria bacterium]|nr:type II toxin-antitoxin system HicB family antitoxin [Gammaproteobacteria bacterium]